jgi:glycosyltransferase involved in cell wall biosynthesis
MAKGAGQEGVTWTLAVLAHNEERTLARCLNSVLSQELPGCRQIVVLANGCTDRTREIAAAYAQDIPHLRCVATPVADKAGAWNLYVHEYLTPAQVHFFADGDVHLAPHALTRLWNALHTSTGINAAGAVAGGGRNARLWTERMVAHGHLAGCLYGLAGHWIEQVRGDSVRLPAGLIGEDLLLSCLAKGSADPQGYYRPAPSLRIVRDARFYFDPLSVARPADWLLYLRRRVRYRVRDRQLALLLAYLSGAPERTMPADVKTLYHLSPHPPGYYWQGWETPFDWLAVRQMRRVMRKAVGGSARAG